MSRNFISIIGLFFVMISCHRESGNLLITTTPVFKVSTANPTADKPQSKLWFQNDCWWAILPSSAGPSLWQRTSKGWTLHRETEEALTGVPGRSDVWPENNSVTAVGVADHFLTVYQLEAIKSQHKVYWKSKILVNLFPPDTTAFIETATIARDKSGVLFVAAVVDAKVFVWISDGSDERWSVIPVTLSSGLNKDDICVVTPLGQGIGVIWSDQNRDGVFMRMHIAGKPDEIWETEDVIEKGKNTADDHLNTCFANNNILWLASKNSVDSVGKPQLVLRIRHADGSWKNMTYANVEKNMLPTRPIVVLSEDNSIAFTGFSNNSNDSSCVVFSVVDTTSLNILRNPKAVILPDSNYHSFVNNVTGPRFPFPMNKPWIVLASDQEGRVYEFDLKKLLSN